MIIKSMSRKVPSFDQLIHYMDAGASGRDFNIYYNLYSRKADSIYEEFMNNSQYLQRRKNGVFMYHEVISITRSQQLSEKEQINILRKVVYQYIQERARENLVYGVLHDEKEDNLHYHLLISSNHFESAKRHRLTKADFDKVKRNLELYVLECHPELQQKKLISKERGASADNDSLSNKGREMQRRTGKTPQRDRVKADLERIFAAASSHAELIELMESERLSLYKRGKYWGVKDERNNRKHRFVTLGVAETFAKLDAKLSLQEQTATAATTTTANTANKATVEQTQTNSAAKASQQAKPAPVTDKHTTASNSQSRAEKTVKPEPEQPEVKETEKPEAQETSEIQSKHKLSALEAEQVAREAEMKNFRQQQTDHKASLKKKR